MNGKLTTWLLALLCGAALFLAAGTAFADGVLIAPAALGKHRTSVLATIQSERAQHPNAFAEVAKVRSELRALDANKRGRLAVLTPRLKAIGDGAVWAMVEELAVDAKPRGDLSDSAWLAWRLSLLEATGMLRDTRTGPVMTAILDSKQTDFEIVKASAEALARLGTDGAASKLVKLADVAGDKQKAVRAGMGHCRRTKVAESLAKALAAKPDAETTALVARSLGDVGSALAWKTSAVKKAGAGEEDAVRTAAAKALIDAYATAHAGARERMSQAVLVVDHPSTPSFIASAKKVANTDGKKLLDELLTKFQNSPLAKTR
jgi:hypothetical protein